MNLETQMDIMNVFHDGELINFRREGSTFFADVEIPFLARMISRNFEFFRLRFINCESFCAVDFENKKEVEDIQFLLENSSTLLSCSVLDDNRISLNCIGAQFKVKAEEIEIYDDKNDRIIKEFLYYISSKYWEQGRWGVDLLEE